MKLRTTCFLTILPCFVTFLLANAANAAAANNLRASRNEQRRKLLGESVNHVMKVFAPMLNRAIKRSLADLELAVLDEFVDLEETNFATTTCKSAASGSLGYSFEALSGLDSIQIDSWELVPGTDVFTPGGFLGWGNATWSGTWLFKTSVDDDITSKTTATIEASNACAGSRNDIDESVAGSIVLTNPTLDLQIAIDGTSSSVLSLGHPFAATSMDFQDSTFTYDSLVMSVDGFDQDTLTGINFDLDAFLQQAFVRNLNDNVIPQMMEGLQNNLGNGLRFKR